MNRYTSIIMFYISLLLFASYLVSCAKNDYKYFEEEQEQLLTAEDGSQSAIEYAALAMYNDTRKGGYRLISTSDLLEKIEDNETLIIIDTRSNGLYRENHIVGAINISAPSLQEPASALAEYNTTLSDTLNNISRSDDSDTNITIDNFTPIIFYSSSLSDRRSGLAAVQAIRLGYRFVYVMPGGFASWDESKFPTE